MIFDPNREQTISAATHHMRVDYSAYEGRKVRGVSEIVLSRGEVIVDNGKFFRQSRLGTVFEAGHMSQLA